MTAVGKILVFLNLVFSLAVGGFAIADYTARTHWVDGYNKLKAQYDVVRTANEAYAKEAKTLRDEKATFAAALEKEVGKDERGDVAAVALARLKVLNEQLDVMKKKNEALTTNNIALAKSKTELTVAMEGMKTSNSSRQEDTKVMRDVLGKEMKRVHDLTLENNQMRDDMVVAQIQARTYKERNMQLEAQVREFAVQMAQLKTNLASTGRPSFAKTNPPPENVEGLVRASRDGLIEIGMGSDSGIQKGQTLEVFRMGAAPRYIGRIRIIDVQNNSAVGQAATRMTTPVQVGDKVASSIMGGN